MEASLQDQHLLGIAVNLRSERTALPLGHMTTSSHRLPEREVPACGFAMLIAFVGVIHETVGATLFPYGPAAFGGL